jgi:hypothetical protein
VRVRLVTGLAYCQPCGHFFNRQRVVPERNVLEQGENPPYVVVRVRCSCGRWSEFVALDES